MKERKIVISVSRMDALVGLLASVLGLWQSTNTGSPNQHLAIDMLSQGLNIVKELVDGQKIEGGG